MTTLSRRPIGSMVVAFAFVAALVGASTVAEAGGRQDVRAPNAPADLQAVAVSANEVALAWSPPANRGVTAYTIRRGGQLLTTVTPDTLMLSDTDLASAKEYVYTVDALYRAERLPGASTEVVVKTPGLPSRPDTSAPTSPEGLTVTPIADGMLLDWYDAIDDTDITAYQIYRDGELLATVNSGTLSYVDITAPSGSTVAYSIVARDPAANASTAATAHRRVPAQSPDLATLDGPGLLAKEASERTESHFSLATSPTVLASAGFNPALRRYPYLTDLVGGNVTVNWATDRSNTKATVAYGEVGVESCTARQVPATRSAFTVNSVKLYQWKASLALTPGARYCYRVYLGGVDLLGSDPAPIFSAQLPAGSTEPFSFAVLGDWGSVGADGSNPEQAQVMQRLANSGARFALTTGDNAYPSGSHNNYGDLVERGSGLSAVFAPEFWTVAGSSIPIFPALGNHGFSSSSTFHPHMFTWPQDHAVATSGGRYQTETHCCLNGTQAATYPSAWYAFDAGVARFYVLEAAWADSNVGTADSFKNDYDYHWTPTSAQYQWLQHDLASNAAPLKFAFFHYPMYSDSKHEHSDPYLQGAGSLEGLLSRYNVNIAFNGHAHMYQRNLEPHADSVVTQLTGGGGAKLGPIEACSPFNAYGIGWSYSANGGTGGGSACGAATRPTAPVEVFHFLLVSVNGPQVTVTPIDATGRSFDVVTYDFGTPPSPTTTTTVPEPPPTTTTTVSEPPPTTTSTTTTTVPPPPPPAPAPVFADGFESGNLAAWTSSAGLIVQSDLVRSGNFAARGNTTTGNTFAKKTLPATYSDGYARTYFNLSSYSSQVNLLRLRTAADSSLGYLFVTTSGKLALRNDVMATTTTSAQAVTAGWHSLELRMLINGPTSLTEVWLDGVKVNDLSLSTNLGSTPIGRLQIGEVQSGRTYNVAFDDVVFDGTPIGP